MQNYDNFLTFIFLYFTTFMHIVNNIAMKKFKLCFKYYTTIGLVPIFITLFLVNSLPSEGFIVIIPIIFSKLFAFGVIWLLQWLNNRRDENLYFYYNQGISKAQLYAFSILFDFLITLIPILFIWLF